jgi:hypothetical protein
LPLTLPLQAVLFVIVLPFLAGVFIAIYIAVDADGSVSMAGMQGEFTERKQVHHLLEFLL